MRSQLLAMLEMLVSAFVWAIITLLIFMAISVVSLAVCLGLLIAQEWTGAVYALMLAVAPWALLLIFRLSLAITDYIQTTYYSWRASNRST
jgi:hypothetical protein